MGWLSCTIDQDVINKDKEKMMYKGFKYFFHETLEGGRCIAKSKGNHQEIIMALMSVKISFRNIHFFHANLVLARVEIKFGEVLSILEFI